MFDFLKREFLDTTAQPRPAHTATRFDSTLQLDGNDEALILTVWKDLVRVHRLPAGAVSCDVLAAPKHSGEGSIWVRLHVLQWSDTLSRHLMALQNQLHIGLDQYEPGVDHSHIKVLWSLDPQCGCPHTSIADTVNWAA